MRCANITYRTPTQSLVIIPLNQVYKVGIKGLKKQVVLQGNAGFKPCRGTIWGWLKDIYWIGGSAPQRERRYGWNYRLWHLAYSWI